MTGDGQSDTETQTPDEFGKWGAEVVPLAGVWFQVVTTPEPIPRVFDVVQCPLGPSALDPAAGCADADEGEG